MADGMQCLLTGSNVAAYFIWDGIRAFDYLLTRPDVDPKRIAVAGNSGGGTQSSYLAAFEPRIGRGGAVVLSHFVGETVGGAGPPGFRAGFRGLPERRSGLPRFSDRLRAQADPDGHRHPGLLPHRGRPGHIRRSAADFSHSGRRGPRRLLRVRRHRTAGPSPAARPPIAGWHGGCRTAKTTGPNPISNSIRRRICASTETGQVVTYVHRRADGAIAQCGRGRATVCPAYRRAHKGHPGARAGSLRLPVRREPAHATNRGTIAREGYRIEKIELESEPGITVPALAFVPQPDRHASPRSSIWTRTGRPRPRARAARLKRSCATAASFWRSMFGDGAKAPFPRRKASYSPLYQTSMRALLVGKTMPGMQTTDVLCCIRLSGCARGCEPGAYRGPRHGKRRDAGHVRRRRRAADRESHLHQRAGILHGLWSA